MLISILVILFAVFLILGIIYICTGNKLRAIILLVVAFIILNLICKILV